jgi:hypothetical protein
MFRPRIQGSAGETRGIEILVWAIGCSGVPFGATAIAEASHSLTSRCTEVVEARIASGGKRGEFQFESDASAAIP